MRLGSMFSGYGGLDMAANEVFGSTTAWHCEIDKNASRLLGYLHPEVPNFGDVATIDWAQAEPVDILTAGFPCQPVSDAGRKLIHDDPRWLWPHVLRAVGELRPGFVFLENVAALLGRGFSGILGDLASIGFDAEWGTLRASDAGAPHQRNRLFVLSWPADPPRVGVEGGRRWHQARGHGHADSQDLAPAEDAGREPRLEWRLPGSGDTQAGGVWSDSSGRAGLAARFDWPAEYLPALNRWERLTRGMPHPVNYGGARGKSLTGRVATEFFEWMMGLPDGYVTGHGLSRSAELKLLGNGVVPQQAELALTLLLERAWPVE